jgi:hypothetical protein
MLSDAHHAKAWNAPANHFRRGDAIAWWRTRAQLTRCALLLYFQPCGKLVTHGNADSNVKCRLSGILCYDYAETKSAGNIGSIFALFSIILAARESSLKGFIDASSP